MLGDFNVDLRRSNDSKYDRETMAKDRMNNNGYAQFIRNSTHTHNGHRSLIDMIFTNEPEKVVREGQIETETGHNLIYGRIKMVRRRKKKTKR